jgi:AraC-like DNA-binding protein
MDSFALTLSGRERWDPHARIARHRHGRAYTALVLSGSYEESGSRGRFRVGPGDVLLHGAFDAHQDRFCSSGAQILNLLVEEFSAGPSIGRIADPDEIMRIAERDEAEAAMELRTQLRPIPRAHRDWPDKLADDLLYDSSCLLDEWARENHLAAATVSRGFKQVFDVTPAQFRMEARTQRALAMIAANSGSLASIAALAGFADQAHMTRSIRLLTGATPGQWRRSNRFKTSTVPGRPNPGHESSD